MNLFKFFSTALLLISLFLFSPFNQQTFAQASDSAMNMNASGHEAAVGATNESILPTVMDAIIFILFLVSIIFCVMIIGAIGPGVLNVVFYTFGAGVLFVGLSRLFLLLSDKGVYHLHDVTMHIWWHLIFYFGMITVIWGGERITDIAKTDKPVGFNLSDKIFLTILLILAAGIFLSAQSMDSQMAAIFEGSIVDTMGLHHFLAFILAGIAGIYMLKIKKTWGDLLKVSVAPVVIFLLLMGLQHLWELLIESWKVITIPSAVGETVEQFIVAPAVFFFAFAMFRVYQFIHKTATMNTPTVKEPPKPTETKAAPVAVKEEVKTDVKSK